MTDWTLSGINLLTFDVSVSDCDRHLNLLCAFRMKLSVGLLLFAGVLLAAFIGKWQPIDFCNYLIIIISTLWFIK